MIILSFLQGVLSSGRIVIAYIYMSEFLSSDWMPFAGSASCTIDAFVYLGISAYFDWISKNYIFVCSLGAITSLIALVLIIFLLPESPLWLLKSGKIE